MTDLVDSLKALLSRQPHTAPLSPSEIKLVYTALASNSTTAKSLSLVLLSSLLTPTTPSNVLDGTTRQLKQQLQDSLAGTDDTDLQTGLNALAGIIQVSPQIGIGMLLDGAAIPADEQVAQESTGLRKRLEEAVEFVAQSGRKTTPSKARIALLELLALAAGHSGTRSLVRRFAGDWLQSLLGNKVDEAGISIIGRGATVERSHGEENKVIALAGLSVVKLLLGKETPSVALAGATQEKGLDWDVKDLVLLFRGLLVNNSTKSANHEIILPSLEALAYLTLLPSPRTKSLLTTPGFLAAFFSILTPPPTTAAPKPIVQEDTALEYAIATLLANLTSYPVPLDPSSEAEQLRRLKSFASAKSSTPASLPVVETPAQVNARVNTILFATPSILPHLVTLSKSSSKAILRLTGKIYLNLCEQPTVRGKLIQGGAAKSLLRIIAKTITTADDSVEMQKIASIQALAKLLITSNPALVLNTEESLHDALSILVIPIMLPIREEAETNAGIVLLIKFECLMALTNLASLDRGNCADRLAGMSSPKRVGEDGKTTGQKRFLSDLQDLLLHDNTLVRRATTELICNLSTTASANQFYRPPPPRNSDPISYRVPPPLHLLIILISSDDLPTRTAASGAIAALCDASVEISRAILLDEEEKRGKKTLEIIINLAALPQVGSAGAWEDSPLAMRGCSIVFSLLEHVAAMGKKEKDLALRRFVEQGLEEKFKRSTGLEEVREGCMEMLRGLSK